MPGSATTPVGHKAIEVPSGMLAVSVELTDPARVGTFVTPGSHIAIYQGYQIKDLRDTPEAKIFNDNDVHGTSLLLPDVLVIGMGDSPLSAPAKADGTEADAAAQPKANGLPRHRRRHAGGCPDADPRHQQPRRSTRRCAGRTSSSTRTKRSRTSASKGSVTTVTILWDASTPTPSTPTASRSAERPCTSTSGPRVSRALEEDPRTRSSSSGPTSTSSSACELAEQERIARPELGVILLRHRLDVTALAQALRSGVREVVPADDQNAIADAIRRSNALTAQLVGHGASTGGREGKVITVFSAKGGVGKTTISTNLATYLASTGARTVLIDLDLMFGDVAISLQLQPPGSVRDLVAMSGHLDEQGVQSVVMRHEPSGLDVIAAPPDPADAERVPSHVIIELLRVARASYDYVIVDTPPSFTEHVLAAFDVSDLTVLVATLDIPAVKNLRIAINTLDTLGRLEGVADHRAQPLRRQGRPAGRGRRGRAQAPDLGERAEQPLGPGLGEPRRGPRPRRAAQPGVDRDAGARRPRDSPPVR